MNALYGRGIRVSAFHCAAIGFGFALLIGIALGDGDRLLRGETGNASALTPANSVPSPDATAMAANGRKIFLLNCAHCHAQDATGDEGPDLHGVVKSDAKITALIKNGVKGEMPKFGAKLSDTDVQMLIAYVRSLN
jgi:mono/diheme cytochrome c family protein